MPASDEQQVDRVSHWRFDHPVCADCPLIRQLVGTAVIAVVVMVVVLVVATLVWSSPRLYREVTGKLTEWTEWYATYSACVDRQSPADTVGDMMENRSRCAHFASEVARRR